MISRQQMKEWESVILGLPESSEREIIDLLLMEIKRLSADYPGGDIDSQARAWSAVWKACENVGMLSCWECLDFTGRNRVVLFIEHLAGNQKKETT